MTLHMHKVDDRTCAKDGTQPLEVAAGWEIAPDDADSARVCGAHFWQSSHLVLGTSDDAYYTAMIGNPSYTGKCDPCDC